MRLNTTEDLECKAIQSLQSYFKEKKIELQNYFKDIDIFPLGSFDIKLDCQQYRQYAWQKCFNFVFCHILIQPSSFHRMY